MSPPVNSRGPAAARATPAVAVLQQCSKTTIGGIQASFAASLANDSNTTLPSQQPPRARPQHARQSSKQDITPPPRLPALPELAVLVVNRADHRPDELQLCGARPHHSTGSRLRLHPPLRPLVLLVVLARGNTLRPVRDHRPELARQSDPSNSRPRKKGVPGWTRRGGV